MSSYIHDDVLDSLPGEKHQTDINVTGNDQSNNPLLGYGWAGLFRKYLVDSPYMWWPANLVQVSLF
ncbi:hypothetical protein Dsin_023458, partial [Dipteronia sinensis]